MDLVDDIDGDIAVETVSFGLDGAFYEIDLSVRNSVQLRSAFERYIAEARKAPGPRRPRRGVRTGPTVDPRQADVRRWAKDNGWPIGQRGRLPAVVLAAYSAAHPG